MSLPGRKTERLSCVSEVFGERGPLRSGLPLRVLQVFIEQSSVCNGGGLRQQAQELVSQDKQRSVPTVTDCKQIVY